MRILDPRLVLFATVTVFASLSVGCAGDEPLDPDEDLYPVDRAELADESMPDEVDFEDGAEDQATAALICQPEVNFFGSVERLSVDGQGRMRARGTVGNDNPGLCPSSVNIRLTRNGTRIDSQDKGCSTNSCTSRLLSAANPPGNQRFCAVVRRNPGGPILAQRCIQR
jgi:hypothetical protein